MKKIAYWQWQIVDAHTGQKTIISIKRFCKVDQWIIIKKGGFKLSLAKWGIIRMLCSQVQ